MKRARLRVEDNSDKGVNSAALLLTIGVVVGVVLCCVVCPRTLINACTPYACLHCVAQRISTVKLRGDKLHVASE